MQNKNSIIKIASDFCQYFIPILSILFSNCIIFVARMANDEISQFINVSCEKRETDAKSIHVV